MENTLKEIQAKVDEHYALDELEGYDWEEICEYLITEVYDYFEGIAGHYIEPGHEDAQVGILLANWNDVPQLHQDILENSGYDLEWSDEWYVTDTGGAVRTSPDSYCWQPSFVMTYDSQILTPEDDPEEVIEAVVCTDEAHTPRPFPCWLDPADHGFFKLHEDMDIPFRTGFHEGMNDDPEVQLREAFSEYSECEVVFTTKPSQFYTEWEVWVRLPSGLDAIPDYPHLSALESKNTLFDEGKTNLHGLIQGWRWDGGAWVAQLWNPETERLEQLVWNDDLEELTINEVVA